MAPYAYQWFIEGEVLAAKGRHDDAAMAFEAAAASHTDDVVLMARLTEEYESSGAPRHADRALAVARRYHPDSARVALAEGHVRRSRGEYDEALASFARAEKLAPDWDEAVVATAETLSAGGQTQRASALLLGYLGTSQGARSARARGVSIDLARHMGDAEALERILALDPRTTPAERARATAQLALDADQPILAARMLTPALDTPENTALWLHALARSGDREKATAFLITADSKLLGGVLERVDLLLEVDEAATAFQLLETTDPSPRAEYTKGRALLAGGYYVEAAMMLANVPFGAASYEASRLAFAECAISLNRPGAAAEALSQAQHGSLAVRSKLADIYVSQGDLPAGLRLFDPKQPADRAALATLFERAGHFDEAAVYYANGKILSSDGPQLQARASAEQLAANGERRGAIGILERWTAVAPDDLYARVRLIELLLADNRVDAAQAMGHEALEVIVDPLLRAHLIGILETPGAASE